MKIEVGEFIRLKSGLIGQFYNIEEGYDGNVQINFEEFAYEYEDIEQFYNDIKLHSKILSEVVEVGDYVNGKEVYIQDGKLAVELAEHIPPYELLENIEIETILTKELYKSNCYTVERREEC